MIERVDRIERLSRSSAARAPCPIRMGTADAALCRLAKCRKAVVCARPSGMVRKVASSTKPSVPCDPTRSPRRMPAGVSESRKASRR